MSRLICGLLLSALASLPAAVASAAPFAEYNPATGDVVMRSLYGLRRVSLYSRSGALRIGVLSETPDISPPTGTIPKAAGGSVFNEHFGITWSIRTPPAGTLFSFDVLTFKSAVPSNTAIGDLSFGYSFADNIAQNGDILKIPEPSPLSLAILGIAGVLASRRRK